MYLNEEEVIQFTNDLPSYSDVAELQQGELFKLLVPIIKNEVKKQLEANGHQRTTFWRALKRSVRILNDFFILFVIFIFVFYFILKFVNEADDGENQYQAFNIK